MELVIVGSEPTDFPEHAKASEFYTLYILYISNEMTKWWRTGIGATHSMK